MFELPFLVAGDTMALSHSITLPKSLDCCLAFSDAMTHGITAITR